MVTRVEGTINGDAVLFERAEGDAWQATVPPYETGEYAAKVTAYDGAGNKAYTCTILLTFGPDGLSVRLLPDKFKAQAKCSVYSVRLLPSRYQVNVHREGER